MVKILGIETACDDTAVAVVEDGNVILSNIIASQHQLHKPHGGIVPEIAARQHTLDILPTIQFALDTAEVTLDEIDAIAVNNQRGLLRSLVIGVAAAKSIALGKNKPLYAVHHVEGHIYSAIMGWATPIFPHLCLTVAGGHNYLVLVNDIGNYELIAQTRDDAAGETLDKIADILGLGFPGGPALEKLASNGDPNSYPLPRPLINSSDADFSFSGLKTAARRIIEQQSEDQLNQNAANIAASVQQAVVDVLVSKATKAAQHHNIKAITLAGGVAANTPLRQQLSARAAQLEMDIVVAAKKLCTDNGAMIAGLAYHYHLAGKIASSDIDAFPANPIINWS